MKGLIFLFLMLMSNAYAQETRFYDSFFRKRENNKTENVRKFLTENESVRVEEYKAGVLQDKITIFGITKTDEIDEFVFYCRSRGNEFYYKPYFKRASALLESYEKELLRSRIPVEDNHFLYIQIWDENGNPLLTNGSGYSVEQTSEKDEDVYTYYKDSVLVVNYGIRKEQRDTIITHSMRWQRQRMEYKVFIRI